MSFWEVYNWKFVLLLIIIAYLVGNISPSYLLAKRRKNIDIRTVGSGNAGTTNTLRYMGKKAAVIVLLVDALKGAAASYMGYRLGGIEIGYLCALAVIVGHVFPALLKFKGGKGVATSIGSIVVLAPYLVLIALIIALLVIWKTRYVSLGAMTGVFLYTVLMIATGARGIPLAAAILLSVFIAFTHRSNIVRLKNKTERKLGEKVE
ncbi:MAG: glycerol-3-phosphate 1-O-acyltransferase PlsY [Filifactor alocis]|nr:glycerol-3-phosphate 1-O-acyltransferase PlsY [Filifactor alocis]